MNVKKASRKIKNVVLRPAPALPMCALGVSVGLAIASAHYKPLRMIADFPTQTEAFDALMAACEKQGLTLYAFDAAEKALWLKALSFSS